MAGSSNIAHLGEGVEIVPLSVDAPQGYCLRMSEDLPRFLPVSNIKS